MVKHVFFSLLALLCITSNALMANDLGHNYEFGPGDHLKIKVYQEDDLSFDGQISQQGKIDFPLLGSVHIAGLTQINAKLALEKLLKNGYLVSPNVSIQVTDYRPFFIYGEVRNPGSYKYQPDITLEQVVALSGGLKDRASRTKWMIQRGSDKKTFTADATTIILPGDIIKIDKSFF